MTITTRSRRCKAVIALAAAALIAAACSDDTGTSQPPAGTVPPDTTTVTVEPADTTPMADTAVETTEPAAPDTTEAPEPTADTAPVDTTEADVDEPVTESTAPDDDTAETQPETTDETDSDTDGDEAEPATDEPDEGRSEGSVFPPRAYFDHDAIRALFPNCPPPPGGSLGGWIDDLFDHWDGVYADWDTDSQRLSGLQIASGWWTDEQLADWYPGGGITAASARRDGTYDRELDTVKLWPVGPAPPRGERAVPYYWPATADGGLGNVYARAVSRGYPSNWTDVTSADIIYRHVRDDGMPGNAPNPPEVDVGMLLLEWTLFRYQRPPTTGEPAAYAMRTLLEAHDPNCVAAQMRSICDFDGKINEPLLHREDRFGRVLWSLVCPQA